MQDPNMMSGDEETHGTKADDLGQLSNDGEARHNTVPSHLPDVNVT